jgi:hypothetical protein
MITADLGPNAGTIVDRPVLNDVDLRQIIDLPPFERFAAIMKS